MATGAEWSRYQIVAGLVTSSSPVPLRTRRVGQRCTLNLSRAETFSRWCGVVVRKGGASSDSDEDIRLNESNCEESEESADVIDIIPINPDIYASRDGTEWIPHNSNVPGRFVTRNVLRQRSVQTSFAKHNVNVSFL
ncbi:uncharacterized protein TNCV_1184221 [Trichonephila clavipes]|nr:uncharacterized protein TNCV_1184221 [Trichonephila clavipes]